jgi:hypothetical protein
MVIPIIAEKPMASKAYMFTLKYYNCFELGHISYNCPKPRTERTKQVLTTKLAVVLTGSMEVLEKPEDEQS